jgi:rhodanese-related sulfurtransferase
MNDFEKAFRVILGMLAISCLALIMQGCPNERDVQDPLDRIESLYQGYRHGFPTAPEISVDELFERMEKERIILVDNREPEERRVSMIPGSIADKDFEAEIEQYEDGVVVVYCTIGNRSGYYAENLRKQEMDAYNLKGGVLAWAHAGRLFVDNQGNETNRVHVYGRKWNLLPDGYEAIW